MKKSCHSMLIAPVIVSAAGTAAAQDRAVGGRVGEMSLTPADVELFKKPSYSP